MEGDRWHGKDAAGVHGSRRAAAERGWRAQTVASPARPGPVRVTGERFARPFPEEVSGSRDPGRVTTGEAPRRSSAGGAPGPIPEEGVGSPESPETPESRECQGVPPRGALRRCGPAEDREAVPPEAPSEAGTGDSAVDPGGQAGSVETPPAGTARRLLFYSMRTVLVTSPSARNSCRRESTWRVSRTVMVFIDLSNSRPGLHIAWYNVDISLNLYLFPSGNYRRNRSYPAISAAPSRRTTRLTTIEIP
jgi:hypothetical protein